MKTQVTMLKVKVKSLAEEARIIRLEERRAKPRRAAGGFVPDGRDVIHHVRGAVLHPGDPDLLWRLRNHRRLDVRAEQRSSLLAYAFLRGRPLAAAEPKAKTPPDRLRVAKLVEKFGVVGYDPKAKADQAAALRAWWEAAAVPAAAG